MTEKKNKPAEPPEVPFIGGPESVEPLFEPDPPLQPAPMGKPQHTAPPARESPPAKTAQKTKKPPAIAPESFFVYLGPSIRGAVQHGAIFKGPLACVTAQLEQSIAKYPLIRRLLIPESAIVEDRVKVQTPGNLLHQAYAELERQIRTTE